MSARRGIPRGLAATLGVWGVAVATLSIGTCAWARIPEGPAPPADAVAWAFEALEAARLGAPAPTPPSSARDIAAHGPLIVDVWSGGRRAARAVGPGRLVDAVAQAVDAFGGDAALAGLEAWRRPRDAEDRPRFSITWVDGEGPLLRGIPFLSPLTLVPVREGLVARAGARAAWATPSDLQAAGAYDGAVDTPVPDLSYGLDVEAWAARLATALDAPDPALRRFRARTLIADPWPADAPVTAERLRTAATEGADFLLRHMEPTGAYSYRYDPRRDRSRNGGYNLTRHAGTTWFLAQAGGRLGRHAPARAGARRALRWIRDRASRTCGGEDRRCIVSRGRGAVGATALTALAAAELLVGGPDRGAERLLRELTAFLRAQQRPDGELMHEYDLEADAPVDVQRMFASGEAALALLRAHDALGDPRDLDTARKLMAHLTGAGWRFPGSRYYYGTEHWTCLAVGAGWDRIPSDDGYEFCARWAAWNANLRYDAGDTPWDVAGAYGVGPVVVPRVTHAATNAEGMISVWQTARARGEAAPALRRSIEATLGFALRYRYAPGPVHLFAAPERAFGGMPASPASLGVRNDYVQHAGSAMLRWAAVLDAGAPGSGTGTR